jgi:hypothetical protein
LDPGSVDVVCGDWDCGDVYGRLRDKCDSGQAKRLTANAQTERYSNVLRRSSSAPLRPLRLNALA